jgi:nucleotide-binding universal stress UspA family protein
MHGPLVVGTDGSETSRLAIEEAALLSKGTGRPVVLVFVRHPRLAGLSALGAGGIGVAVENEALNAEQCVAEAQGIAILDPVGADWKFEVRTGDPATELMRAARDCGATVIVVAGRRHGTLGGVACGSVCSHLLHRWPHSLLVIHRPTGAAADHAVRKLPSGQ